MTAWWLRAALAGLALAALGWWWAWHDAHPWVAAVGALALLGAHAPVLGLEFLVVHAVNRQDAAPRATWAELALAWWHETRLGFKVFGWWLPFAAKRAPDHLGAAHQGRRAVVLVHGFMCNRGMWLGWMRRLRAMDVPHVAVNLEPTFGSIDDYAKTVGEAVTRAHAATGMPPVIVAHSMGGLVARAWMRALDVALVAQPGDASMATSAVHRVLTLGTPHRGTAIGAWNPLPNVVQMRHDGPWVTTLGRAESEARRRQFVCFYSHCDNIVFPASTATLVGADNRHVRGTAHMQLIEHPAVWAAVMAAVNEAEPS